MPPEKPFADVSLPVDEARSGVTALVRKHRVVVIVGETGSGKTTRIPQFILDDILANSAGHGGVCCTQPRRVAAITIAQYVALMRRCDVGGEVGYAVRFDEKVSSSTRLKFVTDGILLRELLADSLLRRYRCVILDEAHERTLHGDVLFGLLKQLICRRSDLKIVIMSATLNAQQFSDFWGGAPIGYIPGRAYPVTVYHASEPQLDYVDALINTVVQIHLEEPMPGDVLCFLTGQDEIEDAKRVLEERRQLLPQSASVFDVCTLYAAMSPQAQLKVFQPPAEGTRKVVLATNIAETSITMEGIKFVIDCGMVKQRNYDPQSTMDSLQVVVESKAQARQRAGRAGRVASGKCFRLFTETAFDEMVENAPPEIKRCNLASVVLQMKAMNIDDIIGFDFMDPPSKTSLLRALQQLSLLGALDANTTKVTALGREMVKLPVEPMAAKAITKGTELGVAAELCAIIAMLSADTAIFASSGSSDAHRSRFAKTTGDHITLLHVFMTYLRTPRRERAAWCDGNGLHAKQMTRVLDVFTQLMELTLSSSSSSSVMNGSDPNHAPSEDTHAITNGGGVSRKGHRAEKALPSWSWNREDAHRDHELVRQALAHGFFLNSAYYSHRANSYVTLTSNEPVAVHPSSVLFRMKKTAPLILFDSLITTSKNYMRNIVVVREDWLHDASPLLFPHRATT